LLGLDGIGKRGAPEVIDLRKTYDPLEGIIYDMAVFGDDTTDDRKDIVLIAETLLRLPEKAKERVLEEVIFIITDGINGCY
jgi:hypothetical protein